MPDDAIRKAALEAAAKESYKAACREAGVKPVAWTKVPANVKKIHHAKAVEALVPPQPAPPPQSLTPQAAIGSADPQAPPPLAGPLGGSARVLERDEDPESFNPEGHTHVVLDITRGNLRHPLKVPVDVLAPDVTSMLPLILTNVRDAMLRAQKGAQGHPTQPVHPTGTYALEDEHGNRWAGDDRMRLSDFKGTWQDKGTNYPCLSVTMVDKGEDARVAAAPGQAPRNVGMGNPVVIGTEGQAGHVLGVPVHGGQPQQQPGPPPPADTARVAHPGQQQEQDPGRARV